MSVLQGEATDDRRPKTASIHRTDAVRSWRRSEYCTGADRGFPGFVQDPARARSDDSSGACAEAAVNERYLREWLSHQAASNYLSYDPMTEKFELPPERAMVFMLRNPTVLTDRQ
jgi:Rv2258c-like winged HTH domain